MLALAGKILCAGGDFDFIEPLLAFLECWNDFVFEQLGKFAALLLAQAAVSRGAELAETLPISDKIIIVGLDDAFGVVDVAGDVTVLQRCDCIEVLPVILDVDDLPMAVLGLFENKLQGKWGLRIVFTDF